MTNGTPRTPFSTATMPISSLNPYQSRVTIRGRVSSKSDIKTWSKASGQGKLFTFEVFDDSGEIRVTAFNEQADKFFELIQPKQVSTNHSENKFLSTEYLVRTGIESSTILIKIGIFYLY